MNWVPYVITAVLLITVILEYRLKHIATDRRTTKHKVLRRWLLGILIIGIISQQAVSAIKEAQRKEDETAKDAAAEETRRRQENEIRSLRNTLVTNTLLNPEFRAKLLDVPPHEIENSDDVNLSAWRAEKQRRLAIAHLQQESGKREQEQAARSETSV